MNEVAFKALLKQLCVEEAEHFKDILVQDDKHPWNALSDKEFVKHMQSKLEALAAHFMRRAYLFGEYRVNGNRDEKLPKLPVNIVFADVYKAYDSIVIDANN